MRRKAKKQRCGRCGRWCRRDASGRTTGKNVKRFCAKDENLDCWKGRMYEDRRRQRGPSDRARAAAALRQLVGWPALGRPANKEVQDAVGELLDVFKRWGWL